MNTNSHFPTPFPNEDYRSILYRYHLMSLNLELSDTIKELYGIRSDLTVFPRALEVLLEKLPPNSGLNVDKFLFEHTLLPLVFPFLSEDRLKKIMKEIRFGGGQTESCLGKLVGNKYYRFISSSIKYCPRCMVDDELLFGCSYIHREHQYAFLPFCQKHKVQLISHCKECGVELVFMPLKLKCIQGHKLVINKPELIKESKLQIEIQNDIDFISLNYSRINGLLIRQRFKEYLKHKGYIKNINIDCLRLSKDILNYFLEENLSKVGVDKAKLKQSTFEQIFRGNVLVIDLPLILIIIRFLAGSLEKFINEKTENISGVSQIPFGNGPWKCENKLCPYYKINVIKKCIRGERTRLKGHWGIRGEFECDFCKSGYNSLWKDGIGVIENQVNVIISDLKKRQIQSLLEQGYRYKRIASMTYCSIPTVKKYCKNVHLDLFSSINELASSIENTENTDTKTNFKKQVFRKKLCSILLENPDINRNGLLLLCNNESNWLRQNDREWFYQILPAIKIIDWKEIDELISSRIEEVSDSLKKSNPKTRIGVYTIINNLTGLEKGRVKNKSSALPKTIQALNSHAESKEEYQLRYLPSIVQQLRTYYGYRDVSVDTVQSYRRSYRNISKELKEQICERLLHL